MIFFLDYFPHYFLSPVFARWTKKITKFRRSSSIKALGFRGEIRLVLEWELDLSSDLWIKIQIVMEMEF